MDVDKTADSVPITPLGDRVLVEKVEGGEEVRSGILLPKSSESSDTNIGIVRAVGSGRETDAGSIIKPKVAVGQKVLFSWGDKVTVDGKEYHLVSEGSVIGILTSTA
ncbi:MAG: co-chaperone GroES [Candidatus Kaiserbacteria bacterium]|nr:co-chaperone GroES [Candidatus Kaiserbacteria bacterium]